MVNSDDEPRDQDEEEEDQGRGPMGRPSGDSCPKGHTDWQVLRKGGKIVRRCRSCGFVDQNFKGKIVL